MKEGFSEDDSGLVEACIGGDLSAWALIVERYSGLISISINNALEKHGFRLPRQEIEDIRQEVLASIWRDRKLESVKNRKDISFWLSIVAGNSAISYMRKMKRREPVRTISLFDKIDETELADIIPLCDDNPLEWSWRNELSGKLDDAVDSLPAKEKIILKLNLLHGKRYKEIADILNIPKGTVSSYIKRAKDRLREALKDFK